MLSLFWAQVQQHAKPYRFPEDNALKLMVEYVIFISLGVSLTLRNPKIRDEWRSQLRLVLSAVYAVFVLLGLLLAVLVKTARILIRFRAQPPALALSMLQLLGSTQEARRSVKAQGSAEAWDPKDSRGIAYYNLNARIHKLS